MGALFSGANTPPQIPMPPPAATPPTLGSNGIAGASSAVRAAGAAAQGLGADGTVQTTPTGLTQKASTAPATLLGQ